VRIEVGRGLESIMTDAMSKLIIENAILPEFRKGDFGAGIRAGADQQSEGFMIPLQDGMHEGGAAVFILRVDIGAACQQCAA